jgi:hypothetical protein
MRPVQHGVLGSAVETLEHILGRSGEVECLQTKVLQARVDFLEPLDDVVTAWVVVRMPKDLDIRMEGFQGMFGVLASVSRATLE